MPGLILTLDEYADAIDRHFHRAREIEMSRNHAMSRRIFKVWALNRFKEMAPVYGPLDLTSRNWIQEQAEEAVDGRAYGVIELEKVERGL